MIYLDNAATTPLDPEVLDAMMPYLTTEYGNPGSLYAYGRLAKQAVDDAREMVAGFFTCKPEQIIFTSGGSEGNNMVIRGLAKTINDRERTNIIVSQTEHDSVWKACGYMASEFTLIACAPDRNGVIPPDRVKRVISPDTGLVSIMYANNETGAVNDVGEIAKLCKANGAFYHSDCVQAAGILDLNTERIPADFMTISAHKIGGPKGMGAIFARDPSILEPLIFGGAVQEFGYRGGTENVAGIVGMGNACRLAKKYIDINSEMLRAKQSQLIFVLKRVAQEDNVQMIINGDIENISPKVLSVCFPGVDAGSLQLTLDVMGIYISTGSACRAHENTPSRVLTSMGISDELARNTIRISISHETTDDEIIEAARTIVKCASVLQSMR